MKPLVFVLWQTRIWQCIRDAIAVAVRWTDAAREAGRRGCLLATQGILGTSPRFRRTLIGEQPVWDPATWAEAVRTHRSMREQLRRARAKGVRVRELAPGEEPTDAHRAVVARWLAARPMAPMHFLVDVAPFDHREHRRVWIAERDGEAVALLSLAPVAALGGWLFEFLPRDPDAPNGTAESLVDAAMRTLAGEGVHWASLGLAPLAGPVSGWLRAARTLSRPFFNFAGLWAFKRKLRPERWGPVYLAYPRESNEVRAMLDGLRAFAGGSLVAFGLRTALRGPRPLLRALELLLLPWTLALALVPTSPWFPSRAVHLAWIVFDIALVIALRVVRQRGRSARPPTARATGDANAHDGVALAHGVATAVTIDAILTALQAWGWSIPAAERAGMLSVTAWIAIAVACAGPLLAAPVLWGAARRMRVTRHMRQTRRTRRGVPATVATPAE